MRRILYPSTIEFIKRRANAVVLVVGCAAILAIGWIALLAIGLVLNFALEYTLEAVNAPDWASDISSRMVWANMIVLGGGITLASINDALNLLKSGLENPREPKDGPKQ